MSNNLRKNTYLLKHILSQEWLPATLLRENETILKFLISDSDIFFEEGDKILYAIKHPKSKVIHNSVVTDIDFTNDGRLSITIDKPIERRTNERYLINIPSEIVTLEKIIQATATDISRKGFKIESKETLNINDEIKITLTLTDNVKITCNCIVIYKNLSSNLEYYVYGLKLSQISYENKLLLNDFIETLK